MFRDADTIEIWSRIKDSAQLDVIRIEEDDETNELYERELPGSWHPVGLNQNFLFAVYPLGGHFAPHTDGREIHRESFHTFFFFLFLDFFFDFFFFVE